MRAMEIYSSMSPTPFERSRVQALLFDLDGTLINSTADLVASGNWLRAREGLGVLESSRIAGYVGDGVEALVRRLLERPEGDVGECIASFMHRYNEHCLDETYLYPGVAATLQALQARGYAMAVVTNKPERVSKRILGGLGVEQRFRSVIGGNSCEFKKPRPEPLLMACGHLACEAGHAVMVGDSRVDVEAGHNAGMPVIGLLHGIGDQALLKASGPDLLIERFERLTEML
jgi:phosphoglycolate phosphatase